MRYVLGLIHSASVASLLGAPAHAVVAPQSTDRASISTNRVQGDGDSEYSSVSGDGRFVAFESSATNLVPNDNNGFYDIFVRDRMNGTTECVSTAFGGGDGDFHSYFPRLSDDGSIIAFYSSSSNLVAGDTNSCGDVFVHDRSTFLTQRVSVASNGTEANGNSAHEGLAVSADGRFVAFWSDATNLVVGDSNSVADVFVHDRLSGTTERVSVGAAGAEANARSYWCSISADGRYVAFESEATNLVAGDTNGAQDVFVRDRVAGTTERVSVGVGGAESNGSSNAPSISGDGRRIAFESIASNLVSGDTNSASDIFMYVRDTATMLRVSVSSQGDQGNNHSFEPCMSADGQHVGFRSDASNLVLGDTNGTYDIFVVDVAGGGKTVRASVDTAGAQGDNASYTPAMTADGRFVAFTSFASNLVTNDTNDSLDVFVRDRGVSLGTKYCTATSNSTGSPADIAASGSANAGAGDLTMDVGPVPNQFGVFFHGSSQALIPFGNGFLCATGGITRGAVISATANAAQYVYDNSDAKHSVVAFVSTTRNFQYWFRDPMGGGALFNTSNALALAILP